MPVTITSWLTRSACKACTHASSAGCEACKHAAQGCMASVACGASAHSHCCGHKQVGKYQSMCVCL